jgi:hypothetical protein
MTLSHVPPGSYVGRFATIIAEMGCASVMPTRTIAPARSRGDMGKQRVTPARAIERNALGSALALRLS